MALPTPRDLPTTVARWDDLRKAWVLSLPGGITREAKTEADVEAAVKRWAPYSAISYRRG